MGKINWTRVFLGGLAWWVVAMVLYMRTEVIAAWKVLGLHVPGTLEFAVFWFVFVYAAGVLAMWLYAAIRPRFGPGPKTAVGAGVAFWLIAKVPHMIFLGAVGAFSIRFVVISTFYLLCL